MLLLNPSPPLTSPLQPSLLPGHCWPFPGAAGRLTVALARPVVVTGVTIDHPSPGTTLARDGDDGEGRPTAPADFTVWRVRAAAGHNATAVGAGVGAGGEGVEYELLGRARYDAAGPETQTFLFPADGGARGTAAAVVTDTVQLRIASNHGHAAFTCLYRFRVHGHPSPTAPAKHG